MSFAFDPLLSDVAEAAMADWGEPVTLIAVARSFDASAGESVISETETPTTGIRSGGDTGPRKNVGGLADEAAETVLVRTADVPDGRLRLRVGGRTVEVASRSERPGGLTALLLRGEVLE